MNPNQMQAAEQEFDSDHDPKSSTQLLSNDAPPINSHAVLGAGETEVYSVRFSDNNKYIAAATNDGTIDIYNVNNKALAYQIQGKNKVPFSCVRWRQINDFNRTSNVLLTCNSEGEIQHWHMTTGKLMSTVKAPEPGDPQLFNLDYNYDSSKFAVVGANGAVQIYDAQTRQREAFLDGEGGIIPGHSNRTYSCKFVNDLDTPNLIVSGGWDNRIIIWDLRTNTPVDSLYGHNICGDAIDIAEGIMLTCSFSDKDQIQMYDIKARIAIKGINGPTFSWDTQIPSKAPTYLYCGQFNKTTANYILAGGAYGNEAKIFDISGNHCATITDLTKEVHCCDFTNDDEKFAIAGGDGYIRVFSFLK